MRLKFDIYVFLDYFFKKFAHKHCEMHIRSWTTSAIAIAQQPWQYPWSLMIDIRALQAGQKLRTSNDSGNDVKCGRLAPGAAEPDSSSSAVSSGTPKGCNLYKRIKIPNPNKINRFE